MATVAQGNRGSSSTAADQAWANVAALWPAPTAAVRATPPQPVTGAPSPTERARLVAQAANDFYTTYPDHPQAAVARKLEALASVEALRDGDGPQAQAAWAVANEYRRSPRFPRRDRFEVAVAMERQQHRQTSAGRSLSNDVARHAQVADTLHEEFGEIPEVYGFYLSVANTADFETAQGMAAKVAVARTLPSIRSAAQTLLDRHALLGQPLPVALTATDGTPVTIAATGRPTVVFFWSAENAPDQPALLARHGAEVPSGTRWIYVALESGGRRDPSGGAGLPFPGTVCADPRGFDAPAALALKLRSLPFLFVLDGQARLAGFGRVSELPRLLQLAER